MSCADHALTLAPLLLLGVLGVLAVHSLPAPIPDNYELEKAHRRVYPILSGQTLLKGWDAARASSNLDQEG